MYKFICLFVYIYICVCVYTHAVILFKELTLPHWFTNIVVDSYSKVIIYTIKHITSTTNQSI